MVAIGTKWKVFYEGASNKYFSVFHNFTKTTKGIMKYLIKDQVRWWIGKIINNVLGNDIFSRVAEIYTDWIISKIVEKIEYL